MPDFRAQFRDPAKTPIPYMGGTAVSCGEHPSLPKRHWWGPWRVYRMPNPNYIGALGSGKHPADGMTADVCCGGGAYMTIILMERSMNQ